MRSSTDDRSWWRRNRLAVLAIPVVLVLAVAANGLRLERFWWNTEFRSATAGQQGEFVTFHQDYTDYLGSTSRTLKVRLEGVTEVAEVTKTYGGAQPIPDGVRALRVDLSFEADPEQSVSGCWLGLVDDEGTMYEFDEGFLDIAQDEPFACHELARPGPRVPTFKGQTREVTPGEERPASWQMHPVVLVPEDAEITEVRLWWELPQYLSLTVT